jgi:hypothetical protein
VFFVPSTDPHISKDALYRPTLGKLVIRIWKHSAIFSSVSKRNEKKLSQSFNFTLRYIDDVISLNNVMISYFVDRIYLIELEIKDTEEKIAECFQIRMTSFPSVGKNKMCS